MAMFEYTKEMFEKDKKEILSWLEKKWIYKDREFLHVGNILRQLKQLFDGMEGK